MNELSFTLGDIATIVTIFAAVMGVIWHSRSQNNQRAQRREDESAKREDMVIRIVKMEGQIESHERRLGVQKDRLDGFEEENKAVVAKIFASLARIEQRLSVIEDRLNRGAGNDLPTK